ncbi:MAG: hypothetical protein Q7R39_11820, partial [Dehalococcoidia bacterium]|nr:hypothetical protein [Dehalococcoidia bacterium]
SRAPVTAVQSEDKAYFVTSEQFDDRSPRLYTVRVCNLSTGDIDTVGKFQGHATSAEARRAIEGLIEGRKT